MDAEISLRLLDDAHCDAAGRFYDPEIFPPADGVWVASVMFEADPTLNSELRCDGFEDAERAIRAAMPGRKITFTRAI